MKKSEIPSDAAKALRRRAYEKIEEYYDDQKKRYRVSLSGRHTDKSVADELGCSPELIAKLREEFFGANIVPSEPEELKLIQTEVAYLKKEAEDIKNMAAGIRRQAGDWQKHSEELDAKINGLCAEYGWTGQS